MMHYERVKTDLAKAERAIKTALRSEMDLEAEKTALEKALQMVQQTEKKYQMDQQESM